MLACLRQLLRRLLGRDPLPRLKRRGLRVGRNVFLQNDCTLDAWHCAHITIGDDVTFGPRVTVLAHDASPQRALGATRIAPVSIGDRVFVGAGSIILPGVTIGADCIIGAGSVVSRSIPPGSLAWGNPARPQGSTADYLARQQALLANSPCFTLADTAAGGADAARLEATRTRLGAGPGFIVSPRR